MVSRYVIVSRFIVEHCTCLLLTPQLIFSVLEFNSKLFQCLNARKRTEEVWVIHNSGNALD